MKIKKIFIYILFCFIIITTSKMIKQYILNNYKNNYNSEIEIKKPADLKKYKINNY